MPPKAKKSRKEVPAAPIAAHPVSEILQGNLLGLAEEFSVLVQGEQHSAWTDAVLKEVFGVNSQWRRTLVTFTEAKDIINLATAERRMFLVLARLVEDCWINNSAVPDSLVASSFRHISALVLHEWTSELVFTEALKNLPGVGRPARAGGSESPELNQLEERFLRVTPSHNNLRKLSIGKASHASVLFPSSLDVLLPSSLDVSLLHALGLDGLKSVTLCGNAIVGSFEVFMSLPALQELNVGGSKVDCSHALELISTAPWALQIKTLGLSRTNAQGDVAALGNCIKLKNIDFFGCGRIRGSFEVFTSLVALQEFDICNTNIDCSCALELISTAPWALQIKTMSFFGTNVQGDIKDLGACTELKSINFPGCEDIYGDIEDLEDCTKLVKVCFSWCEWITGSFEVFPGFESLQELNVGQTQVDCSHALEVISEAPWAPQIKTLSLRETNAKGDIAAVEACTNLKRIDICDCREIYGSFEVFSRLSALTDLEVGDTDVDCSRALELVSSASWARQIETLDLMGTNVGGDIATLGICTSLREAIFSNCLHITGNIEVLGKCTNLEGAFFYGCSQITGDIAALRTCTQLERAQFNESPGITGDPGALMNSTKLKIFNCRFIS